MRGQWLPGTRDDATARTPWPRQLLIQGALAATYFLAGKVGLTLALLHPSATPVWPATAIALVSVLWLGYGVWPAIFAGAFLVNITTEGTLATSAGIALGNTLEALAGGWLVARFANGRHAFDRAVDVIRFAFLAGLLSTMISATLGVGSLVLGGSAAPERFWSIWLTWWLGDASSNFILAPLLLTWLARPLPRANARSAAELTALFAAVLLIGGFLFSPFSRMAVGNYPVGYLGLIPLLWAAFRFGRRGAATAAFVTSAIALTGTIAHLGPFVRPDPHQSLLLVQAYMATITVTAMILAAVLGERRRAQADLLRATEAAQEANRAKDRFLAMLSHELRTPLTPLLASISLLKDDPLLDARVREELGMMQRNLELETRLIDDLLDLSRIGRGRLELRLQPLDVIRVIEHALQICARSINRETQVTLQTDLSAADRFVHADEARLEQVFCNLLGNALKFMPAGGTLTVRASNASLQRVRIEVIDTGIGIDPKDLPRLFEPFQQTPVARAHFGGLGLGLAISRGIIAAVGGTLEAHSEGIDRGATFTVELPTVCQPAPQPSAPAPPTVPAVDGKLRILLVEDHADSALAIGKLLQRKGHVVRHAGTVADAMSHAAEAKFDLVISDLGLPDGTGLDLMRDLQSRYNLRGIALTGYGMESDIKSTREAGFAEHLIKPIDAHRLEAAIARMASGR